MSKERRKHMPEFKREALRMVLDQQLSMAEVSRRIGIAESLRRSSSGARELGAEMRGQGNCIERV